MPRVVTPFVDPGAAYNATYTSNTITTGESVSTMHQTAYIQVDQTGDATIDIQGRALGSAQWINLNTQLSASAVVEVPVFPEMRIDVVVTTTGTARAYMVEYR